LNVVAQCAVFGDLELRIEEAGKYFFEEPRKVLVAAEGVA